MEKDLISKKIEIKIKKEHKCVIDKEDNNNGDSIIPLESSTQEIIIPKENDPFIRQYIYQNPLFGLNKIYEFAVKNNIKAKKTQIKNWITEIRAEIFPPLIEQALSDEYCITKGIEKSPFFQSISKLRLFNPKKNTSRLEEFVILGSKWMLSQLKSSYWYIDGSFKIVPQDYYQILTILVSSDYHQSEVPAVYILTSCKSENIYFAAFSALKQICQSLSLELKPRVIMADFEKGMRKALNQIFIHSKLLGCFFHYSQAIWRKASKLSLRSEVYLGKTKILICFLKILIHLPIIKRKEIVDALEKNYVEDKNYQKLINYF